MPKWIAGLAALLVLALAAGAVVFEPWTRFTSSTIDEALPTATGVAETDVPAAGTTPTSPPANAAKPAKSKQADQPSQATPGPERGPVELGAGRFEDAEYATSGVAKVIELADGSRFVRLEGFSTSNGPDVFVGLSDSPSGGAWGSYDDTRYVQLGSLKATDGNQNYEIPPDVDLGGFRSVVIWCDRFDVAFGTAPVVL